MATTEPTSTRTVLPGRPPFTVDDLLKFPDDGNRYELFNGSLLVSPAPTPPHQRAISRLLRLLEDAAPPGVDVLSTINVRVGGKDLYIPDVAVVTDEAYESTSLMFEPQDLLLAVEIVSPSTRARDRGLKTEAYAAAGIPAYWRIELDEGPTLYSYALDGGVYEGPVAYKAGTPGTLTSPYEISFDPADLITRRR